MGINNSYYNSPDWMGLLKIINLRKYLENHTIFVTAWNPDGLSSDQSISFTTLRNSRGPNRPPYFTEMLLSTLEIKLNELKPG